MDKPERQKKFATALFNIISLGKETYGLTDAEITEVLVLFSSIREILLKDEAPK